MEVGAYGQHACRGLQSDGWTRFVAGRATCSVDGRPGAPRSQLVTWVMTGDGLRITGAAENAPSFFQQPMIRYDAIRHYTI